MFDPSCIFSIRIGLFSSPKRSATLQNFGAFLRVLPAIQRINYIFALVVLAQGIGFVRVDRLRETNKRSRKLQAFSGITALLIGIVLIMLGNGMQFTLMGLPAM